MLLSLILGENMNFNAEWQKLGVGAQKVCVAVSTGVDSMCLLDMLQHLPLKIRPQITVAYVDHQLRAQSQTETKFIKQYCQKYHLRLEIGIWNKQAHPQKGIEEAARTFRYHFFDEVMQKFKIKYLLTAHHADDQAETFLMKLLRGGELTQLVGIEPLRKFSEHTYIARPLLSFSKEELRSYAQKRHLQFYEDETNAQNEVLRNRLRNQVIPQLKNENPQFLKHVAYYQSQLKDALEVQTQVTSEILKKLATDDGYDLKKWQKLSLTMQQLTLKEIFKRENLPINTQKIGEISRFLHNFKKPQGIYQINHEKQLRKEYQTFKMVDKIKSKVIDPTLYFLKMNGWIEVDHYQIGLFKKDQVQPSSGELILELEDLPSKLTIRHRLAGDFIVQKNGRQKLRRYFINHKIPQSIRDQSWLVAAKHQILAILKPSGSYCLVHSNENATVRYMIIIKHRKR